MLHLDLASFAVSIPERRLAHASERTLDHAFAGRAAALTSQQRWALARWQAPDDRQYVKVQQVADERDGGPEARAIYEQLMDLFDDAPRLSTTIHAWRGIRSCRNTFGVDNLDMAALAGAGHIDVTRFTSFTTRRVVAVREFIRPHGPGISLTVGRVRIEHGVPIVTVEVPT